MTNTELSSIVDRYLQQASAKNSRLTELVRQLQSGQNLQNRQTLPGHITGSAVVLSSDKSQILLVHHKVFDRWQQPGGHWDPEDASPRVAAEREAGEETGVQQLRYLPIVSQAPEVPFDIGSHEIMNRPEIGEPTHIHHDFRYVFIAADQKLQADKREVLAAAWVTLGDPRTEFIAKIIAKLQVTGFIAA